MTGFCVCVPARDEAARLPTLFAALAGQDLAGPIPVALCINNSGDDSMAVIAAAQRRHAGRLALHVVERDFPAPLAHAGSARGAAMSLGIEIAGEDGVLIATDADCRPPAHWIAATLAAMAPDRIVGGRIVIDEAEPLPPAVVATRARIDAYWAAVREIEDAIDPLAWDAAPRHGDHTGASLALTVALYRAAGGVPPIASGEDRALVENARIAGGRLTHPDGVWTRVSPRSVGRAEGGMAEAMAALAVAGEAPPMLPDFAHWRARALWRRETRRALGERGVVVAERALPPMPCDMALREPQAA